ncbi:MAG TPA: metallophosphoesterase family protein [Syntrophobacteria bacterium]|nr:metallophosphoesterase family protein [Syntrophobacteria bacterium]
MKIAVIADIHSNLEAFRAVLHDLAKESVSAMVNLGDLVGYNASPGECVNLAREHRIISIQGNHDRAAVQPRFAEGFNILAHQAVLWSASALNPEQKSFLDSLPHTLLLWDHYLLFHGAPDNSEAYIFYLFQAKKAFDYMRKKMPGVKIAFFGHTHHRALWRRDVRGKVQSLTVTQGIMAVDPEEMCLINPGSVGQPRERQWEASYLIFTTDPPALEFRSVPYDLRGAQTKIREACLPDYLAERLAKGV